MRVKTGSFDLADDHVVGFLQQSNAFGRNLAQNAHRQARPREWLALENFFRHSGFAANFADLIFKEVFERLDQLELHLLRQAAYVVVSLDGLRRATHTARFDYIGIERSLHQPLDLADQPFNPVGFAIEDLDEFVANELAFLFRIDHTGELGQEALAGIYGHQVQAQFLFQRLLDFLEFVFAQHAVVDEHTGKPLAERAMHQRRSYGRIDSSRESADGAALLACGLFDLVNGFVDEMLWCPVGARAADVVNKVSQQIGPQLGVMYFRMELYCPYFA